ncbi:protein mono-ADP-ribosyltransferase PARP14-like [Carassius gibelio]|uniref:protein mono-ADP-ribosyltransferase PARP14-like n=1 Tax=Carassius gibelio TaxID=101364 RepID=UPI00227940E6|nr:protein mono-ADP-ribosyltransferase PARP14-like [Carassius gibelio]
MENYQHAVFFEAKSLSDEELRQIQLYFKIRRRSGGGDCEIYKVGNSTYKISFMNKNAQERVLERKDHVIKVEGQEDIYVSLSLENVTESSEKPTASANQKCAKSVEKVLKLNHYLLRFFSECKSPYSDLEKRLSKVSSTFEINADCEELVVTRDPAAADVFPLKKWEFAVDEVFETLKSHYIIHFEVERDKSVSLEENSFLQSDNLKIFFEELTCLAVVVGERTEVEKRLKFLSGLKDKLQIQQECCMSEKQYGLIKERFEQYIQTKLPALKIEQERAGVLLLKGPEKEVHAGEEELLKLALGIREKRIPCHRAVMTFMESSGSIQHFQNRFQQSLCSPVMLETSGSDLLLLSLSDGALEEAAAAVQRDVCLETVRLENTQKSSALTKLKEDLNEAVDQANRGSVKVELKYQDESTTDPKVQLVGYTTEVNKLKNIVLEYKRNHQNHHTSLPLPRPEMAEHFSDILAMADSMESDKEINIKVVVGSLEQQQADVFVAPMIKTKMTSTLIGSSLLNKAGQQLQNNFKRAKGNHTLKPGEVLEVDGTQALGCSKVFFIESLFHSLTSDLDEIIMPVDGVELHLVFGDITNETTDAIVNTTDFKDFQTAGVCKDILTKAGPQIQAQLTGAQVARGQIFTTQPGGFPCKTIMHICGLRDPDVIKTLAKEIVVQSEQGCCRSVAIPAICAGQGGLDPCVVAKSILEGVKDGVQGANLQHLKSIRIVLLKINVFLAFKAMAKQIFGALAPLAPTSVITRGRSASTRSRSHSLTSPVTSDFSSLMKSLPDTESRAAFLVIGHTNNVSNACREIQQAYKSQCCTHTIFRDEIRCLTEDEKKQLYSKVSSLHLQIEQISSDRWVVKGLKDGVNEVVRLIQDALRRQVRDKEQSILFSQVTWCILGSRGIWQKVPKDVNYLLEKGDVKDGIVDAQGVKWTVNLGKMEAKACHSGEVTALKRLENLSDFSVPIYWNNMSQGDSLQVNELDQSSTEYQTVKADFKKTVPKTVLKIQRIQNMNLRRLYEGRKKELEDRNGSVGAAEKMLYHGTSEESCSSIIKSNFNRSFSGQNATNYGHGTYFAVNASYSAQNNYAVAAADGTQFMFVARVLTGYHTRGNANMKTPPVREEPDRYDSVVDSLQNPSMFVIFHDCQAYPDYLITFK